MFGKKYLVEMENMKEKYKLAIDNQVATEAKRDEYADKAKYLFKSIKLIEDNFSSEIGNLKTDIFKNADNINMNIANQSAYQQQTFASLEELKQTSSSVGENINKALQTRKVDGKAVEDLNFEIESVDKQVEDLNKKLKQISSVVTTIKSVSEETKLLGLNAQIESAKAGDAGKGFAVVATEIQKLSSSTKQASEDIQEMIQFVLDKYDEISNKIDRILDKSKVILEHNEEGIDNIAVINAGMQEINTSISEITQGAEHASTSMEKISSDANTICDDDRIKPDGKAVYIGNDINIKKGEEQLEDGSGYEIRRSDSVVFIRFYGIPTGLKSTFQENYAKLRNEVNVDDTVLVLNAEEMGIIVGAARGTLNALYKNYAQFKKVYVVTGDNHAMKMQLTNIIKDINAMDKYEFVTSCIERNDPNQNK